MASVANKAIRDAARIADVKHWEIAAALNISDEYFSKRMRLEFSDEEREKVLSIIDEIANGTWQPKKLITHEGKWITIDKQLPDEGKNYIVTYRTPKGQYRVKECFCESSYESPRVAYWSKKLNGEVIAWMPLPEAYHPE